MEARRGSKRVEQRGRFTITEIVPGSPLTSPAAAPQPLEGAELSSQPQEPALGEDKSPPRPEELEPAPAGEAVDADADAPLEAEAPAEAAEGGEMGARRPVPPESPTIGPQVSALELASARVEAGAGADAAVGRRTRPSWGRSSRRRTTRRPSARRSTGARPTDGTERALGCEMKRDRPLIAWFCVCGGSVRRKGRFTIIELASDSPTSRKASDEVPVTPAAPSVGSGPQPDRSVSLLQFDVGASLSSERPLPTAARFSRSFTASATGSKKLTADKHHRAARSMTRLREPHSGRRSRLRSESPVRATSESMGSRIGGATARKSMGSFQSTAYGTRIPLLERGVSSTSTIGSSQIPNDTSMLSVLPQQESLSHSVPTPAQSPTSVSIPVSPALSRSNSFYDADPVKRIAQQQQEQQQKQQQQQQQSMPGLNAEAKRHMAALQNSITISAAQFLQQQQTIASLIRQQHDLKQIIAVLHEQQQQLMVIPMQLNELKHETAQGYDSQQLATAV